MSNLTTIAEIILKNVSTYSSACRIPYNLMDVFAVRLGLLLLYVTVFIVAVSGNFLVVYVVMTNKKMQTVTNIFITNLAISDLLVNFTSLWLTPMYTYIGHWVWGGGLCHGLPLFQGTSIFISTMTLTAIAIDRYLVIVHNTSNINVNDRMSMRTCILIVTLIWTLSLALVIPYAVNMKLIYIGQPCNFMMCSEDWSDESIRKVYGVIVLSLQFILPFILIGISYSCIWIFLNNRTFNRERKSEAARKKRLLRMLIIMVVIFAVCWFPFNLLNILRDLKLDSFMKTYFTFIYLLVHLISMTATCWNPILYAWMNESFREEFAKAIPFLRRKSDRDAREGQDGGKSSGRAKSVSAIGNEMDPKPSNAGILTKIRHSMFESSSTRLLSQGSPPNFITEETEDSEEKDVHYL